MSQTIAYVRVSTEDQVETSPEAQAKRCRDFARMRDLGAVRILADEGWSGKNLDRPAMRELLDLVKADKVSTLVVWRWDRLSRDQGDFSVLAKLFEKHNVAVHSLNEGDLDLATATGKMQLGIQAVFAQFTRDQIIENVDLGMQQKAEQGYWQNTAPVGYRMVNGELVVTDRAPLVERIFALRASGMSFASIAEDVAMKYGTVRHVCENRIYLGEVSYKGEWFAGRHTPLVSLETFNACTRSHTPGVRRSKDLLSGKVRCGLCRRVSTVKYNDRNQALYHCKHRGEGCKQPGRSALGLQRAALLGLKVLRDDQDLQAAIRSALEPDQTLVEDRALSLTGSIASLRHKLDLLFELYYDGKVTKDSFSKQEQTLTSQIQSLEDQVAAEGSENDRRTELSRRFEEVSIALTDLDIEGLWDDATRSERQILIDDLVDSVWIFPDQLSVEVVGAPPILVGLDEVGLRLGSRSVVSEDRGTRTPTGVLLPGRRWLVKAGRRPPGGPGLYGPSSSEHHGTRAAPGGSWPPLSRLTQAEVNARYDISPNGT